MEIDHCGSLSEDMEKLIALRWVSPLVNRWVSILLISVMGLVSDYQSNWEWYVNTIKYLLPLRWLWVNKQRCAVIYTSMCIFDITGCSFWFVNHSVSWSQTSTWSLMNTETHVSTHCKILPFSSRGISGLVEFIHTDYHHFHHMIHGTSEWGTYPLQ